MVKPHKLDKHGIQCKHLTTISGSVLSSQWAVPVYEITLNAFGHFYVTLYLKSNMHICIFECILVLNVHAGRMMSFVYEYSVQWFLT